MTVLTPDDRDLRPRSALEMADAAVEACRRSFAALAAASLAFTFPATLVFWVAVAIRPGWISGGIGAGALAIGLLLAHAACVDVIGDEWLAASSSASRAIRRTATRAVPLLTLWLIGTLKVAALAVLLVVPGVVAATALVPAVPILVLERPSPLAAVRRSTFLSRGRRVEHLAALATTLAVVVAVASILVQPVIVAASIGTGRDAPALVAAAGAQVALCVLVVPLFAAVSVATYVDTRVRKEGLDLLFFLGPQAAAAA